MSETFQTNDCIRQSSTLEAFYYADASVFAQETQHIFTRTWQYLGPESWLHQLQNVLPVDLLAKPMLLCHQGSGEQARLFYNVCRHRAGRLCRNAQKQRNLRCHYHGWTYDLRGNLIGTPQLAEGDIDRSAYSLHQVPLRKWNQMLFAVPDPQIQAGAVTDSLKDIPAPECPVDFTKMSFARRYTYQAECNWKVYVDNYLEGYHVKMVHPELASLLDNSRYQTTIKDQWSLQHAPLNANDQGYGSGSGQAHYYFVFPNLMLNLLPGRMQINHVVPRGSHRCDIIFDFYYETEIYPDLELAFQKDFEFSDVVQKQDIQVCQEVQLGLESGAYKSGRYVPDQELGLFHFHQLYLQAMAGAQ